MGWLGQTPLAGLSATRYKLLSSPWGRREARGHAPSVPLGKRAVQASEARQRIIDAARDLIAESGAQDTSLNAVARRANSTRTTVYHQFGSPEELLLAVLNALDRADVREVRKALQHPDAATAMRRSVRTATHFWYGERAIFAQVKGLAAIDPAMAELDALKEGVRRGHLTNLAHRLAQQGALRTGCSERRALDTLLLLMTFETFEQLHGRSGTSVDAVAAALVDMAERALLG